MFWRQRTSIEFNIYEHADADVLEVSSYNIDARVELPHVYLAKSALLVAIEGLFYEKLEAIEQEEDALGIKHFNQDPVQLATLKDQMIGDYITRRTNLTALAEGQEGHFQLTIEPLECKFQLSVTVVSCFNLYNHLNQWTGPTMTDAVP